MGTYFSVPMAICPNRGLTATVTALLDTRAVLLEMVMSAMSSVALVLLRLCDKG